MGCGGAARGTRPAVRATSRRTRAVRQEPRDKSREIREEPTMTAMTPAPAPDPQHDVPGRIMAREMAEQPAVLRRLLQVGAPAIRQVAQDIAARAPRFVLLTARGTSDNAALYAKYLL